MHTVMLAAGGFALLGMFLVLARFWAPDRGVFAVAAKAFIPVWLALTLVNLSIGILHAGYTLLQELPVLAVTFGMPAAVAALIIRNAGGRRRR
jgi:uncharacterized membrane protein YwaF